jgi:hypothetical protein
MTISFAGNIEMISDELFERMKGASWHPDPACPAPADLALLRMNHWDMDGGVGQGELIVAAEVAGEVLRAFEHIFAARFPIARMLPIDAFGGSDPASMAANNCSGFNFRVIAGTDRLSQHALGHAIDINPVQNPMVTGERISPQAGAGYLDRGHVRPGMIVRPGPVTAAFDAIGWYWGGDWDEIKDYHHFSRHGR